MYNFTGRERAEVLAEYIIENNATVRKCAAHFGMSKSTVHKDIAEKLQYMNKRLYTTVRKILDTNKSVRHIRGGEATRKKYQDIKKKGRVGQK
jgi:putative DeoR family transcriptional regulator (stage III sporulation protein D)